MAKRLTSDEWLAARLAWETDPTMTSPRLAEVVGITKQAVSARMKRDEAAGNPWTKKVSMREVAERAQAMADRAKPPPAGELPEVDGDVDGKVDRQFVSPDKKKAAPALPPGATDPVAQRAEIIARHRKEWSISRGLVGEAVRDRNFDKAKLAKITTETLGLIQKGERLAWGLDTIDPTEKPVVIIERSGAGE